MLKRKRKTRFLKSKKGNAVAESIIIIIALFGFGFISVVAYDILGDFNTDFQSDDSMSNNSKQLVTNVFDGYPSWMDEAFAMLVILVWIGAIVSSFLIDTHPIFLAFTLLLMIFVWLIGGELANAYDDVLSDGFSPNSFPKTTWVMQHFIEVIAMMGFTVLVSLFGKSWLT